MPIGPALGAVAAPIAGAAVGSLFGGGGAKNATPVLPPDLQGLRSNNIGLLSYLLGYGGPQAQSPYPPPIQRNPANPMGVPGYNPFGNNTTGPGNYFGPPSLSYPQAPRQTGGTDYFGLPPGVQPRLLPSGTPAATDIGSNMAGRGLPPLFPSAVPGGSQANLQTGGGTPGIPGQQGGDALSRLESYFGPLGTPTTALQQQALGGISQFLNSNPYGQSNAALNQILGGQGFNQARGALGGATQGFKDVQNANYFGGAQGAFNKVGGQNLFGGASDVFNNLASFNPFGQAMTALNGQLTSNPGQGVVDALQPNFQRDLAAAKQEGGRFGSQNAALEARAIQDNNLLAAQALQQGITQQQNAASVIGALGGQLGQFQNAAGQGLLGVGQGQLSQGLGVANGLLGVGQGQLSQGLGAAQGLLGAGSALGNLASSQGQLQLGAAGQLGQNMNNYFNALQGGYQTGAFQAQQEAQRQQQAQQLLQNLLGASFGATLGVPSSVGPTGAQTGAQIGGALGQYFAGQSGGGSMIPPAPAVPTAFAPPTWAYNPFANGAIGNYAL